MGFRTTGVSSCVLKLPIKNLWHAKEQWFLWHGNPPRGSPHGNHTTFHKLLEVGRNNLLVRRHKVEQVRCVHRFSFIHLASQTSPASPLIAQQLIPNLSLFLTVLCSWELWVGMRTPAVTGTPLSQGRAPASLCCPPRTAGGTETRRCEQGREVQGTQE